MSENKDPIVNCHAHIFKDDHVPPFIARSILPWWLFWIVHLHAIMWIYDKVYKIESWIDKLKSDWNAGKSGTLRVIRDFWRWLKRNDITSVIFHAVQYWLILNSLHILFNWLNGEKILPQFIKDLEPTIRVPLENYKVLIDYENTTFWLKLSICLFVFVFIRSGRNLMIFLANKITGFLGILPGKKSRDMFQRYMLLGKFARYKKQTLIYSRLRKQYPNDSRFVVLPMDMEYMGAGKVPTSYHEQLNELAGIKKKGTGKEQMEPFIFIDPRRIRDKSDPNFLKYHTSPGMVHLDDCLVKSLLTTEDTEAGFSGFKIYPALGYYPFDEDLLALWKYAETLGLPIMTHCVAGTIYYRGKKKLDWNQHPVFREDGRNEAFLALPEKSNSDFSINFTHPLNYLCLVHEPLLRILVGSAREEIKTLFGYNGENKPMDHDLSKLKICLAHFGGEEEWLKYLEGDRNNYAQQLINHRERGLDFYDDDNRTQPDWNKIAKIWRNADWYSIICSIIVQHENIFTDVSYILSKPRIMPLLQQTLDVKLNPKLSKRVLYGTDFYVVRNHFSDKDLITQLQQELTDEQFDRIARENPKDYLLQ